MSEYFLLNGKIELYDVEKFKQRSYEAAEQAASDICRAIAGEYAVQEGYLLGRVNMDKN